VDLKDVAISIRRKTTNYRSIYIRSVQKPKRCTKASLTTISKNALSSILSTVKRMRIAKT
jgi:hypothetical protein